MLFTRRGQADGADDCRVAPIDPCARWPGGPRHRPAATGRRRGSRERSRSRPRISIPGSSWPPIIARIRAEGARPADPGCRDERAARPDAVRGEADYRGGATSARITRPDRPQGGEP